RHGHPLRSQPASPGERRLDCGEIREGRLLSFPRAAPRGGLRCGGELQRPAAVLDAVLPRRAGRTDDVPPAHGRESGPIARAGARPQGQEELMWGVLANYGGGGGGRGAAWAQGLGNSFGVTGGATADRNVSPQACQFL